MSAGEKGKFWIKGQKMHIRAFNSHIVVRVGGGWDTLTHYLATLGAHKGFSPEVIELVEKQLTRSLRQGDKKKKVRRNKKAPFSGPATASKSDGPALNTVDLEVSNLGATEEVEEEPVSNSKLKPSRSETDQSIFLRMGDEVHEGDTAVGLQRAVVDSPMRMGSPTMSTSPFLQSGLRGVSPSRSRYLSSPRESPQNSPRNSIQVSSPKGSPKKGSQKRNSPKNSPTKDSPTKAHLQVTPGATGSPLSQRTSAEDEPNAVSPHTKSHTKEQTQTSASPDLSLTDSAIPRRAATRTKPSGLPRPASRERPSPDSVRPKSRDAAARKAGTPKSFTSSPKVSHAQTSHRENRPRPRSAETRSKTADTRPRYRDARAATGNRLTPETSRSRDVTNRPRSGDGRTRGAVERSGNSDARPRSGNAQTRIGDARPRTADPRPRADLRPQPLDTRRPKSAGNCPPRMAREAPPPWRPIGQLNIRSKSDEARPTKGRISAEQNARLARYKTAPEQATLKGGGGRRGDSPKTTEDAGVSRSKPRASMPSPAATVILNRLACHVQGAMLTSELGLDLYDEIDGLVTELEQLGSHGVDTLRDLARQRDWKLMFAATNALLHGSSANGANHRFTVL